MIRGDWFQDREKAGFRAVTAKDENGFPFRGRLGQAVGEGAKAALSAIQFIRNYHRTAGVNQPIKVLLPLRKRTAPAKPLDCL